MLRKEFCQSTYSSSPSSLYPPFYCRHPPPILAPFPWVFLTDHAIIYLLTPSCRVLLEQLTGLQLFKKFPAFHGTRRFITAPTSVHHLSLSWAHPIQSIYPHPTSWRYILILSTHPRLGLPSGIFPSGFPTKTLHTSLSSPIRATCPAHLILLDFITRTILGEEYRSFSSSLCISWIPPLPRPPRSKYSPQHHVRKATISLVMSVGLSVGPSVRPRGTTRFPLAWLSWNSILEYFPRICQEKFTFD